MAEWTEELKEQVIKQYLDKNPTPETSVEIVQELADEHGFTTNGVRAILVRSGNYVSKAKTPASAGKEKKEGAAPRASKQAAVKELTDFLEEKELEVNDDIISKLTGKAAAYFAALLKQVAK